MSKQGWQKVKQGYSSKMLLVPQDKWIKHMLDREHVHPKSGNVANVCCRTQTYPLGTAGLEKYIEKQQYRGVFIQ